MPYVSNPYAPKARKLAINMLKRERLSKAETARRYGVHRSTIGRWLKRATKHSGEHIPTISSRPHRHPRELSQHVIARIIVLRKTLKRCAPVLHAHLVSEGYKVSLPSVQRTLKRQGLVRPRRQARFFTPIPRPEVNKPGDLVEVDTIHYVRPDYTRFYIYTLIDLYSRLAYASYSPILNQITSVSVIKQAQKELGFPFKVVQTDNGPEFRDYVNLALMSKYIRLRHSRVRKPNDNAHLERFNRTIQEECFNGRLPDEEVIKSKLTKYLKYYNTERLHLGLNLMTPAQFVAKVQI